MYFERGKIKNEDYAKVLRDYSGLKFPGGITPTDIDGFLDFKNNVFIFIEMKYGNNSVIGGQRLTLERLVDSLIAKNSLLIIANHNISPKDNKPIDVAKCLIREIRYKNNWTTKNNGKTVREVIDSYLKFNKMFV